MGCGSSKSIAVALANTSTPETTQGHCPELLFLKSASALNLNESMRIQNLNECRRLWNNHTIQLRQKDKLGNNALHYLAKNKYTTANDPWFNQNRNKEASNAANAQGFTPFLIAILNENNAIAEKLWDNVVTHKETIFTEALNTNNPTLIKLLLGFHRIEKPDTNKILNELEQGTATVRVKTTIRMIIVEYSENKMNRSKETLPSKRSP